MVAFDQAGCIPRPGKPRGQSRLMDKVGSWIRDSEPELPEYQMREPVLFFIAIAGGNLSAETRHT